MADTKTIGERIRELRESKGISQEELAKVLGLSSRSTINKIEHNEHDLRRSHVEICARFLGVSPAYLMGWDEFPTKGNNFVDASPSVIEFKVCGSVKAGYDGECVCEFTGETVQMPATKLKGHSVNDYFVLQVRGDSMFPRILDGDKVLVLRTDTIDNNKIGVMMYGDNEATIKKITYSENSITLTPCNTNYSPITISGSELEYCHLLGEVISLIRDF